MVRGAGIIRKRSRRYCTLLHLFCTPPLPIPNTVVTRNPVGYNNAELRTDFKAVGFSFIAVGSANAEVDLTKVSVTGYTEGTAGDVIIQMLDSSGNTIASYQWNDFDKKDKKTGETIHYEGWLDQDANDYIKEGDVVIPAGKGMWVYAPSEEWKILCNGQVFTAGQAVKLRSDFIMAANPYPCDIDLTTLFVSGYDKTSGTAGDVIIQMLDSSGNTIASYQWNDFDKKDKKSGQTVHYEGWLDQDANDYVKEGDVTIKANDGLWTYAPDDTWYLNFPGILDDAPKAE